MSHQAPHLFGDAVALSLVEAFPDARSPEFLRAVDWPGAPPAPPIGEPYDEFGRFDLKRFPNFVSTRICIRFDLTHPCVSSKLAGRLVEAHPTAIGSDGALYLYEASTRSQRKNAELAKARLLEHIREAGRATDE